MGGFKCHMYFWAATSSLTLKLQWGRLTKIRFGDIFLLWCNIDPMSTGLSCTFHDLFKDSPLDHILLMWFGGRHHKEQQGQQEGEDQGGT